METYPPFPGIPPEGLQLLIDLKDEQHQDRAWFKAHHAIYTDALRGPLRCLVADVLRQAAEHVGAGDAHALPPLTGDPRKSVYRIYRDVRFSTNKNPYQTHVACKFSPRADGSDVDGVVYVHIEPPDQSFLAAGLYQAAPKRLRPLRHRIAQTPAPFLALLDTLSERGLTLESHGGALTGMPQGFAAYADAPIAPYLRYKSFLVTRPLTKEDVTTPALTGKVLDFARDARPLLDFLRTTSA